MDTLADLVESDWSGLSDTARRQVRMAFADVVAVALAASGDPAPRAVTGYLARTGPGPVPVPGGGRCSAPHAATGWGTLAHARDFDDVSDVLHGHPSAVLVPVVLALGYRDGLDGARLVDAYLSGYEALARVAAGAADEQRARGWHVTSTIGVLGATVAAARLLGLGPDRTRHALGIATSLAGGLQANFGSAVKPLHAGWAAGHGIVAAELAAAGLDAGPDALNAPASYLDVLGGAWCEPDGPPHIETGLRFKPYPCCGSAIGLVDCALDLHTLVTEGPGLAGIDAVTCTILPQTDRTLRHRAPETGDEARFSPEFCVVQALAHGELDEHCFRRDFAERLGELDPVMRRVERRVVLPETLPPDSKEVELTVRFRDGRTIAARSTLPKGHPGNPMTPAEIQAKFDACTTAVLTAEVRTAVAGRLAAIDEEPPIGGLVDLLLTGAAS